jgi:hypothetical protein
MKKNAFPKKLLIVTLAGVVLISSIYIYEVYFFTFSEVDERSMQKGPGPLPSPTGEYSADVYYELYGGAAGGVNMRVEITNNQEEDIVQTVYYADAKEKISIEWKNEDILFIENASPNYPDSNRSIALEIGKEIYHENGLACKSLLMKNDYEICYQDE